MNQVLPASTDVVRTPPMPYAPVAQELEEAERILAEAIRNSNPRVAELIAHIGHYRGKRLRPALVLLTGRACGRLTPGHAVLAAVMELIHTATLVHDDVLDGATVRRHVPTVNAGWGNQNSVLFGDYLFTHAYYLATTLGDIRVCQMIGETTNRVCEGELRQGLERGNLDLAEDEYLDIIDAKTAELIACCCKLGAHVSGAAPEVIEALTRYGRWLGQAFQIADDLLDLVGDEGTTGKSLGTDLEQQKMTLPLIHLMERAAAPQGARLRQLLSAPGNHKRDALQPYLQESGALDYAHRRAEDLAARARAELDCLPPSSSRTLLERAAESAVRRKA